MAYKAGVNSGLILSRNMSFESNLALSVTEYTNNYKMRNAKMSVTRVCAAGRILTDHERNLFSFGETFNVEHTSIVETLIFAEFKCKPCQAGTYSDAATCLLVQRAQRPQYSTAGAEVCEFNIDTCPSGTFSEEQQEAFTTYHKCSPCPGGRFRTSAGGQGVGDCAQCAAGKYVAN